MVLKGRGTGVRFSAVTGDGGAELLAARASGALLQGGRKVFPQYRLVGYAGLTGASTLGRLGTGPLDQRVR